MSNKGKVGERAGGKSQPPGPERDSQAPAQLQAELRATQERLRRSEQELQAAHAALEVTRQELTQREEQLRQAQKMEAIGRLAGSMAHDYNNLLTSILGYSELLMDFLPEGDPLLGNVEGIIKAAERAAALTEQIQAFKRKELAQPKSMQLNAVVNELEKLLRRLVGDNIELVLALDPNLADVQADASHIKQAVLNLAIHARNMMPRGGKLILETSNVELDAGYVAHHQGVKPGAYVMLAVSDTGVGLDAEAQQRVLEPPSDQQGDTSLGMASVVTIVRQSNGYIWVYSEEGKGSTFRVYLPRVESDQPAGATPARRAGISTARGTETILLAEDNDDIRNLIHSTLQAQGYTVVSARDGAEAIDLGRRQIAGIQLLVTDVVMPHKNGNEVAAELLKLQPGLRVLYMSGYTDNAILHHSVLSPGTSFLPKPFTLDTLTQKVRELLDAKVAK